MPTIGLIIGIIVMLAGVKRKINIGISATISTVILSAASGQFQNVITLSLTEALVQNWLLLVSIALITVLGNVMQTSGAMEKLAESTVKIFRKPQVTIFLLPSFMGFLSVPGASIFSIPMVDTTGDKLGMNLEQKAVANVYYRHLWYFVYPLYPPFIFLQQMTGIPYSTMLIPGIIGALAMFLTTTLVSFGNIKNDYVPPVRENTTDAAKTLVLSILPLATVLGLAIVLNISFPLAVLMGIITAVFSVPHETFSWANISSRIKTGVIPGIDWRIVGAVAGIVFFSRSVVNSQAVAVLATNLSAQGSSIVILSLAAPFLVGVITGSHQASIGISLPILLPLLQGLANPFPFVALVYFSSLTGYLISPAHVCLIGTSQYLDSDLTKIWKLASIPTAVSLSLGLIFALMALNG